MIDIFKNALGTITIEVSATSKYDMWLYKKCKMNSYEYRDWRAQLGNVCAYCISKELLKEFVAWAFLGEDPCCERDYDSDGNCDRHRCDKSHDTVQLKTDLKWDEEDERKIQSLIVSYRQMSFESRTNSESLQNSQ